MDKYIAILYGNLYGPYTKEQVEKNLNRGCTAAYYKIEPVGIREVAVTTTRKEIF